MIKEEAAARLLAQNSARATWILVERRSIAVLALVILLPKCLKVSFFLDIFDTLKKYPAISPRRQFLREVFQFQKARVMERNWAPVGVYAIYQI